MTEQSTSSEDSREEPKATVKRPARIAVIGLVLVAVGSIPVFIWAFRGLVSAFLQMLQGLESP